MVYKPGHTNVDNFLKIYGIQLQQKKRALVFGDFNIDLRTKDKTLTKYKHTLRESRHKLLNKIHKKYCTRESKTKHSILDHVSTNLECEQFNFTIINTPMTDHKQIFLQLNRYKPPKEVRTTYEAIDYKQLYSKMEYFGTKQLANNYKDLESQIKQCIAESRVKRTKILNTPKKDWINRDVITGINERNYLWLKHKENPYNQQLEEEYKQKINTVAKLIQSTKNTYYYKLFTNKNR